MNKIKIIHILIFSLIIVLADIIACEGPTGPEGPQGQQGEQGQQGLQGEEGNANIMYSDWMDIVWSEESTDVTKELVIQESRITDDFLNEGGIVLMFMKIESYSGVVVFYTLPLVSGNLHYRFITFGAQDGGGITFVLTSSNNTDIPDSVWEDYQIRYVLIPGSVNLNAKAVDLKNYETIAEYYGIPE